MVADQPRLSISLHNFLSLCSNIADVTAAGGTLRTPRHLGAKPVGLPP